MALIYIDEDKELDPIQLADEIGAGVNIGVLDDERRFVSADVDEAALEAAVGAHVPDEEAIAERERLREEEAEAARVEAEKEEADRATARESAVAKLIELGLTEAEIEALRS